MTDQPIWPDLATYSQHHQIGRTNWQLQMAASKLVEYSEVAAEYHQQRKEWWDGEAQLTKDKINADGLKVREQQVTGGVQHQLIADPALSARLSQCEQKAKKHYDKIESLQRFDSFLKALDPTTLLIVTPSDAEFFEIGKHG